MKVRLLQLLLLLRRRQHRSRDDVT